MDSINTDITDRSRRAEGRAQRKFDTIVAWLALAGFLIVLPHLLSYSQQEVQCSWCWTCYSLLATEF
jgi:hypothetical protein